VPGCCLANQHVPEVAFTSDKVLLGPDYDYHVSGSRDHRIDPLRDREESERWRAFRCRVSGSHQRDDDNRAFHALKFINGADGDHWYVPVLGFFRSLQKVLLESHLQHVHL
jgi:hypothetical protein